MCTINQDHDVWFLRYKVQRTVFLSFWAIFCPLTLLTTQKIKIYMEILSFYTFKPKMTIIWYMVPDISSTIDKFFCHFALFFALLPTKEPRKSKFWINERNSWRYYHFTHEYHKWKSYDVWFLRYGAWQTGYFSSWATIFCPFTPLTAQKMKISKKWKNGWRYHHFTQVYQNHIHMLYCSLDMTQDTSNFYFSFWAIFCSFTPNSSKKSKLWLDNVRFLRYGTQRTDNRWMDRKSGI